LAEGTDLDTIYSPYKTQMAAILEINPQTISFTDPALRSAIGPNGEMPIYDFQKSLRRDPRWMLKKLLLLQKKVEIKKI
jgi:hypothetical protein